MANSDSESEEGKLILIMGVAGAGKTSFINRLTPGDFGIENTSLSVGISGFYEYPIEIGGKTITLVDTPGADTTEAIFEETLQWLERRDSPDRSVFGIVLLLPILSPRLDRRMFSENLLSGFRKLLDPGLDLRTELHRVVLATTMWTQTQDPHERDKIQNQLRGEWWPLLKRGAQLWECTDTPEFAQAVIDHVLTAQRPHTTVIRSSLIIAVIGLTGSGKSSFIAALTNDFSFSQDAVAEDDVYAFVIEINKQKVILLDTPGLDYRENRGAVFDVISSWLLKKAREISKPQLYLDGVVLTHSILSRHTRGVVPQSLLIDHINPLLGLETIRDKRDIKAYHRVILATTMWDRVHEKDTRDAEEREREIRNHNWNILSTAGAGVMRFDNTAKSAHRITKKIVEERVSGDAVYELRKNVMEELSNLKLDVNSLSKTANPVLLELIYPAATTAGHS